MLLKKLKTWKMHNSCNSEHHVWHILLDPRCKISWNCWKFSYLLPSCWHKDGSFSKICSRETRGCKWDMKSELWSEPLCVFSMPQAIWVGINEEPRFKYIPLNEAACGLTNGEASHMPFLLQVEASNGQVTWTRSHVVVVGLQVSPTITRNLIMFLSEKGECQEPFKFIQDLDIKMRMSSILRP